MMDKFLRNSADKVLLIGFFGVVAMIVGISMVKRTSKKQNIQTGSEVIKLYESVVKGKTYVITGATSGLGNELARQLAFAGAHVILAVRDVGIGKEIAEQWNQQINSKSVECFFLDLSNLQTVYQFAENFHATGRKLYGLYYPKPITT